MKKFYTFLWSQYINFELNFDGTCKHVKDNEFEEVQFVAKNEKILSDLSESVLILNQNLPNSLTKVKLLDDMETAIEWESNIAECLLLAKSGESDAIFSTYFGLEFELFINLSPAPVEIHLFFCNFGANFFFG